MAEELLVKQDAGRTRAVAITRDLRVGDGHPVVIAGPCSVETPDQILETAHAIKAAGAHMLRGGAYKPRTSPYSFQGLGRDGLKLLAAARDATGLPVVTELMSESDLSLVASYADVLQVGARNMHNFALLKALGKADRPVLLKRGMAATLDEWLNAAEYIVAGGNEQVILCERGIRTFEPYTRNTLDLGSALAAKALTHLPVLADPSHGSGRRELVAPLTKAALAAGLDGVLVEVHHRPETAVSDREQTMGTDEFTSLMADLGLAPAACDLPGWRSELERVDRELIHLIAYRARITKAMADTGPVREPHGNPSAHIHQLASMSGGVLTPEAIQTIWSAIRIELPAVHPSGQPG